MSSIAQLLYICLYYFWPLVKSTSKLQQLVPDTFSCAETIKALHEAIEKRPKHKRPEDAKLLFITQYGQSWAKETADNPITKVFRLLLDKLKLHRHGLGFYALRHTFETIGGGSRDQVAVDFIMGHTDGSMAGVYREEIEDERLVAVTNHVRKWLYPAKKNR